MTPAERLCKVLLSLYPIRHRKAYGQLMLLHARDMYNTRRQRGRWQTVKLYLQLLIDGIVNAWKEHLEGMMTVPNGLKPAPWLSVFLASMPGLLIALTRRQADLLSPILPVAGYLYLGFLVFGVPIIWWQRRKFPVWALLPAGAEVWLLTYLAGTAFSEQVNALRIPNIGWMGVDLGVAFIQLMVAVLIFMTVLRNHVLPRSGWLIIGLIIVGNVLMAVIYHFTNNNGGRLLPSIVQYFSTLGVGPVDGLLFVAVGLLAARQHGVLAILVVVGGFSYICGDTDFLFGSPSRDWPGLPVYLTLVTMLFLVVVPVALLRSRTVVGRAVAVSLPVGLFLVAIMTVPSFVVEQSINIRPGELLWSINIMFSILLAWELYSYISETNLRAKSLPQGVNPLLE